MMQDAVLHLQGNFLKKVPLTLKNFRKWFAAPHRHGTTPHNKNTVNTSLVQALLGIDGIFIA